MILLSVSPQIHNHVCSIAHNGGKDEDPAEVRKDTEHQAHRGLRVHQLPCAHGCHGDEGTEQAVQVLWTDLGKQIKVVNIYNARHALV